MAGKGILGTEIGGVLGGPSHLFCSFYQRAPCCTCAPLCPLSLFLAAETLSVVPGRLIMGVLKAVLTRKECTFFPPRPPVPMLKILGRGGEYRSGGNGEEANNMNTDTLA